MGRTPRQRGTEKERDLFDPYEQAGFVMFRSAGSGGAYDNIALGNGEAHLIQVKRRKEHVRRCEPRFLRELIDAEPSGDVLRVHKRLFTWIERDAWYITEPGGETERVKRKDLGLWLRR
jgi:Holliday junction resolvase